MGHRRSRQYVQRTAELEELVCADYHPGGLTLREIVALRRLSLTAVHEILVAHGVRRRPPGNHRKLKLRRGPGYDAEVAQRFAAMQTLVQIARDMRTSRRLVMAAVRDLGLTRTSLRGRPPANTLHASGPEPR